MEALQGFTFEGAVIVEHRKDGENIVGRVVYAGMNGDQSVGIGWHSDESGNRTTVFRPRRWQAEVKEGVAFLKRAAPDEGVCDLPWPTADLYTLVPRT